MLLLTFSKRLTTVPVLADPDTSKPYILYIDVGDDCTGACLCQEKDTQGEMKSNEQNEKPIHYLLHELTASQINLHTMEKEAFTIFYTVPKLDQYLHDLEFVFRTDHKPLMYIMSSPVQNKRIQHWTTNVCGYNCKI